MAFAGLHVACVYQALPPTAAQAFQVAGELMWSQTMSSAATTTNAAPPERSGVGRPLFEVSAAVDSWIAWGSAPDAVNGARKLIRGGTTEDIQARPGDRLAWSPA